MKRNSKRIVGLIIALIAIISTGVLVYATVFGGGVFNGSFSKLEGNPNEIVQLAYKNTTMKIEQEIGALNKVLGTDKIMNYQEAPAADMDIAITVKEVEGEGQEQASAILKDAGVNANIKYTKNLEKMASSIGFKQGALSMNPLFKIEKEGSKLAVDAPNYLDKPIAVDFATFVEDYNASEYRRIYYGVDEYSEIKAEDWEEVEQFLSYLGELFSGLNSTKDNNEYITLMNRFYENTFNAADFVEIESKNMILGDEDTTCKVYEAEIKGEALKEYIKEQFTLFLETSYVQTSMEYLARFEKSSREELVSELIEDLEVSLEEIDEESAIVVRFAVDKFFIVENSFEVYNQDNQKSASYVMQLLGGKYICKDINISAVAEDMELDMRLQGNFDNSKKDCEFIAEVDMSEAGNKVMGVDYAIDYALEAQADNYAMSMKVNMPQEAMVMDFSYKGTVDIAEDEISIDLNDCVIDVDAETEAVKIKWAYNLLWKTISPDEVITDFSSVNWLFKLTEEELENIQMEIQSRVGF